MFAYIKRIANYIRNQSNHSHNLLSHKTCSRTAEKKIILLTIELSVIQRRIVSKTFSKSRETTVSFDHDEKKNNLKVR